MLHSWHLEPKVYEGTHEIYQSMLDFKRPDGLNATLTNQSRENSKVWVHIFAKKLLIQQQNCSSIQEKNNMKFLDFFGGKPRGGSWLPPGRRSLTIPMTFTSQTARVGSTWNGEESWSWPQNMPFLELAVRKSGDEGVGIICGGDVQNPNVSRWDILDIETPGPNCQRRF